MMALALESGMDTASGYGQRAFQLLGALEVGRLVHRPRSAVWWLVSSCR